MLLLLPVGLPVGPPLFASGVPHSKHRARASVAHSAADYGTPCRTPGSISRTLAALLLALGLLLALLWLLGLRLLLGWRCRWWRLRLS